MAEFNAEGRAAQVSVPQGLHDRRKQGQILHHEETYTTDGTEVVGDKIAFMMNVPSRGARIKKKASRIHFGAAGSGATMNVGYRYTADGSVVSGQFATAVDIHAAGSCDLAEAGEDGNASFEVTADDFQLVITLSGADPDASIPITADLLYSV